MTASRQPVRKTAFEHVDGPPLLARDALGEPAGQLVRIRNAALTKAQVPADLRTVVLDRPTAPHIRVQLAGRYLHLPGDELHRLARQLETAPGNPAVLRIELQLCPQRPCAGHSVLVGNWCVSKSAFAAMTMGCVALRGRLARRRPHAWVTGWQAGPCTSGRVGDRVLSLPQ